MSINYYIYLVITLKNGSIISKELCHIGRNSTFDLVSFFNLIEELIESNDDFTYESALGKSFERLKNIVEKIESNDLLTKDETLGFWDFIKEIYNDLLYGNEQIITQDEYGIEISFDDIIDCMRIKERENDYECYETKDNDNSLWRPNNTKTIKRHYMIYGIYITPETNFF